MSTKARDIALAGVTTALALVFSLLAVFVEPLTASFCLLSAVVVMLPITKGRYLAALLSFAATSCLLMLFATPLKALPFIIVFGSFTIFTTIAYAKKWKWYYIYPIKLIWINAALAITYLATDLLVIDFDKLGFTLNYFTLSVVVTVLGLIYDTCLLVIYKQTKALADRYIKW